MPDDYIDLIPIPGIYPLTKKQLKDKSNYIKETFFDGGDIEVESFDFRPGMRVYGYIIDDDQEKIRNILDYFGNTVDGHPIALLYSDQTNITSGYTVINNELGYFEDLTNNLGEMETALNNENISPKSYIRSKDL